MGNKVKVKKDGEIQKIYEYDVFGDRTRETDGATETQYV